MYTHTYTYICMHTYICIYDPGANQLWRLKRQILEAKKYLIDWWVLQLVELDLITCEV